MEVWTIWLPFYWLSGLFKALAATVSLYAAIKLVFLIPQALAMLNVAADVTEQKQAEEALQETKDQLQAVLDAVPASVSWISSDLKYLGVNRYLAKSFNWLPEAFVGKELGFLESSPSFSNFVRQFFASTDKEGSTEIHSQVQSGDSEALPPRADRSYLIIAHKYHQDTAAVFAGIDVTQLKQTQIALQKLNQELESRVEARTAELKQTNWQLRREIAYRVRVAAVLRKSEEQFRCLSLCSPVGIFLTDTEGRCTYANPRCQAICGFTFSEDLGSGWLNSVYAGDRERLLSGWSAYQHSGQEYSDEFRFISQSGIVRYTHLRSSPMFADNGELIGYVGTVEDITERKQAEEDIKLALQKEKELSELKSGFVSMTSHEFRTPLTTILASAELLEYYGSQLTDEQKRERLHRIKAAVKKLTHLLNEVLIIGKADAGKLEFKPGSLDLDSFCREWASEMQLNAGDRYTLNFVSQGNCHNTYMDKNLLEHIITNLLSNAIKYSPQGGNIDFELVCERGDAIFRIQDSGIGIPAEDLVQLFNSFHRAKNVGTIAGTGLGLAIVKNCVDVHKGKIEVKSEVGLGTRFIVTLPCCFLPGETLRSGAGLGIDSETQPSLIDTKPALPRDGNSVNTF
jgi:PAS domain S-box-containing protein